MENEALIIGNDFMESFEVDLKKEMEKEIAKFTRCIVSGQFPKNEKEFTEQLEAESVVVEKDLATAFQKDLKIAVEKEIMRISKRILHDTSS